MKNSFFFQYLTFFQISNSFSLHGRKFWTPKRRARHNRDLLWMTGVIVGLVVPVALGVYIVFNLTCMRNPVGATGANMFNIGGNYDMWQQAY